MANIQERLTVVGVVHHQPVDQPPYSIPVRFSHGLTTKDEQPYERKRTATETWEPLDCGWIEKSGYVVIINRETTAGDTNPTPERIKEIEARVLEVTESPDNPDGLRWLILPGAGFHGMPSNPRKLFIRSQSGPARYTICLIPG